MAKINNNQIILIILANLAVIVTSFGCSENQANLHTTNESFNTNIINEHSIAAIGETFGDVCSAQTSNPISSTIFDTKPQVDLPRYGSEDLKYRVSEFQDRLSLFLYVSDITYEILDFGGIQANINMYLIYQNVSPDSFVVRIPKWVTTRGIFEMNYIEFVNLSGDEVPNLENYTGGGPIQIERSDFVQLEPNGYHCAMHNYSLLVSDDGEYLIDGEIISLPHLKPGDYKTRIIYHNHYVGIDNYDLNSWVGEVPSNYVKFELTLSVGNEN